jgi:type VI secretion system lysozyme-like protein
MPDLDLVPSVFDRLADPDLAIRAATQGYPIRDLEAAIREDLLDLLNTHRPPEGMFAGNPDVERSVANYGLRDLAHLETMSSGERAEMARHIKDVIETYEPRLCDVEVQIRPAAEVEAEKGHEHNRAAVYFRITAALNLRPHKVEGVSFITMLELTNGRHDVFKS